MKESTCVVNKIIDHLWTQFEARLFDNYVNTKVKPFTVNFLTQQTGIGTLLQFIQPTTAPKNDDKMQKIEGQIDSYIQLINVNGFRAQQPQLENSSEVSSVDLLVIPSIKEYQTTETQSPKTARSPTKRLSKVMTFGV